MCRMRVIALMQWSRLQPARSESSRDSGVDGHTLSQRLEISLVPRASRSGSRATMFEQSCSGRELSWSERTSDPATSEAAGGAPSTAEWTTDPAAGGSSPAEQPEHPAGGSSPA